MNHDQTEATILFKQNFNATAHIVINQGGSSSGKTYAIQQVLFCLACAKENQVITVVGQDIPNLKAGVMRDASAIHDMSASLQIAVKTFNKSDRIYEFHNGSIIEFKSYGDAQDAKSGKRDYLFINEANGIKWDVFAELSLRTRIRIFLDYNPNTEFWVHDKLIGQPDVALIISDHRHNPFLTEYTHNKIEKYKDSNEEFWKVYARGLTGKITGLVFKNWYLCEEIPKLAKLKAIGLDFGFSNDETGCIEVYMQDGELWVKELLYEKGLTNQDISAKLNNLNVSKNIEIVADSAEPKSIEELRRLGWNIKGAKKGPDSIKNSIDILKRYKINITRSSVNLRKEIERYKWRTDNTGRTLNEPIDTWNHLIDPLRYIALNKLRIGNQSANRSLLPHIELTNYNPIEKLITI